MRRLPAAVAAGSLLVASCFGGRVTGEPAAPPAASRARGHGEPASPPRCDVLPGLAPEGFALVRDRDRPQGGRVGSHRTYRSPDGRRLDYLLGIAGEVGEGLPLAGTPALADGSPARLLGRATTWALVWSEPPPCDQSAIIGNGMTRGEFLALLAAAGVLADR